MTLSNLQKTKKKKKIYLPFFDIWCYNCFSRSVPTHCWTPLHRCKVITEKTPKILWGRRRCEPVNEWSGWRLSASVIPLPKKKRPQVFIVCNALPVTRCFRVQSKTTTLTIFRLWWKRSFCKTVFSVCLMMLLIIALISLSTFWLCFLFFVLFCTDEKWTVC